MALRLRDLSLHLPEGHTYSSVGWLPGVALASRLHRLGCCSRLSTPSCASSSTLPTCACGFATQRQSCCFFATSCESFAVK